MRPVTLASWRDIGDLIDHQDWLDRWPNFLPEELACNCGGRFCDGAYHHDEAFLDALQALRNDVGRPLKINSGHRCARWNAAVGGAPMSQHKRLAVDISLDGHDRHALEANAIAHGFTGIGRGLAFIHLDRRAVPTSWNYGAASRAAWSQRTS
jgi:hypothetical protein